MFFEPYGLLEPQVLEMYIRSQSSCEAVGRVIKTCFLQIGKFMNGLERVTEIDNVTISKVQESLGLNNFLKAKQLCNKLNNNSDISSYNLSEDSIELARDILLTSGRVSYITEGGDTLSDFQCKLVDYIDSNIMNKRRGKLKGLDVYMRIIDSSVMSGSRDPKLLTRNVGSIVNYVSCYPIIKNLKVDSKLEMGVAWNEINNFKNSYLRDNAVDDTSDIRNIIQMIPELKHVLSYSTEADDLCYQYLEYQFKKFDFKYFNQLFGTNLSEIEMHKEFMDVLSKGLCGFNLNIDYFLDGLRDNGVYFKKTKLRSQDLNANENIKFITGPLYNMITHEMAILDL